MLIRPALVAATTAALVLLPLGVANAQTYEHFDAVHDVQTATFDDEATQDMPDFTPAPAQADPDIRRVKINHGAHRLSVRVHFRDLTRSQTAFSIYSVMIRTNEHKRREVDIFAAAGMWKGQAGVATARGDEVHCKGLRHHISYRLHDVLFRVPRSCLGDPRWVQVAGISVKEVLNLPSDPDSTDITATAYVDDAFSDGINLRRMNWSPRIHRD